MTVYKFFGQGTGGAQDSVATIDIQFDGDIVGMSLENRSTSGMASTDFISAELSFLSVNTFTSHDARGSLIETSFTLHDAGTGATAKVGRNQLSGIAVPVNAGERVHLHLNASAGEAQNCVGYVYVADNAPTVPIRRR